MEQAPEEDMVEAEEVLNSLRMTPESVQVRGENVDDEDVADNDDNVGQLDNNSNNNNNNNSSNNNKISALMRLPKCQNTEY
ncbi:hypothetical protein ACLKA6_010665 [Drosophila palustris]